jgi:integrase
VPRVKKGRNPDGAGGYELLESGLVRHVRTLEGRRLKGPARETREEAKAAWEEQHLSKPDEAEEIPPVPLWQYVHGLCNRENGELRDEQAATTVSLLRSIYNKHVRDYPDALKPVSAWTPPMARAWAKSRGVAPRTLERYIAAMKGVFRRAKTDGLYTRENPFATVVAPAYDRESEKKVLPRKSQKELLAHLEGRTRDAAVLWLHGLRRGEAAGLRYEDFDGEGITIRRQVQELDTGIYVHELTKNTKRRWVALDADGLELMRRGQGQKGWVLPCRTNRKSREGDAIRKKYGSMCSRPHNIYRDLVNAIAGTEWEGTHPHDYRSSTATDLISSTDIRTAAEIMGHDPRVMIKDYARSSKIEKKKAMDGRK